VSVRERECMERVGECNMCECACDCVGVGVRVSVSVSVSVSSVKRMVVLVQILTWDLFLL